MRYSPQQYAIAFADLAERAKTEAERAKLVKDFWATVRRNGDGGKAERIANEAERLLARRLGRKHWLVESARPLAEDARKLLHGIAAKDDVIEAQLDPDLIAGVRVTADNEHQYDGSLRMKLNALFTST
jgi:F0F1-type ATP synthase delta subunit